jgi:hypothetical protein
MRVTSDLDPVGALGIILGGSDWVVDRAKILKEVKAV